MKRKEFRSHPSTVTKFVNEEAPLPDLGMTMFFNNSPDLFCIVSKEGFFLKLNPAWEQILGYSIAELMSRPFIDFLHPDDIEPTLREFSEELDGKPVYNFINRYRCKDGTFKWLEWHGKPNEDGNTASAVARDISESKTAQDTLWEREIILQAINNSVKDAVIMLDNDGLITYWNNSATTILGYSRAEVTGKNFHDAISPKRFHDQYQKAFQRFQTSGEGAVIGKTIELMALHKNGTEFPVELSLSAIKIDGKWCSVGILHNITERKYAEEEMKRNQILLRTLIDNLPDTIYVKDKEGRKIVANESDWKLMGYNSEAEVIGKTDLELFNPEIGMRGYNDDMEVITNARPVTHEENFIDPEGNVRWLNTTKIPLRDGHSNVVGLVGIGNDITNRKSAELKLLRQTEELRETNAEKDRFFSIIAHDLRSPFNGFLGLLNMMEENFQNMSLLQLQQYIRSIGVSANKLYNLLDNLLEWSRVKRGMVVPHAELFQLKPQVKSSCELLLEAAQKKRIGLFCEFQDNLSVYADKRMVGSILRNLLSNAVKYTPKGGKVTITAQHVSGAWLKYRSGM